MSGYPRRKTPGKPERGVLSAVGVVAAPGSCTHESPALLSGWIIRNDRLGNVGIKLSCELCQKPQPNQNQSTSAGVWGCVFFLSVLLVVLHWTETFSVQQFFCLLALGERSGCAPCTCVCLTTFREFFDDQVVIDGKNPDGMWGYAYLLLFTSKNKKRRAGGGTSLAFYFNP